MRSSCGQVLFNGHAEIALLATRHNSLNKDTNELDTYCTAYAFWFPAVVTEAKPTLQIGLRRGLTHPA